MGFHVNIFQLKTKLKDINCYDENIFITSAIRTAVGSLGKSLKNIPSDELGSAVIKSAITKSGISESVIDEVIMGQVLTGGRSKSCKTSSN